MNVYVIFHRDDMDESAYVVGVYEQRAHAERDRVDRTPSGRPSRSYDAHTKNCCEVLEFEVVQTP